MADLGASSHSDFWATLVRPLPARGPSHSRPYRRKRLATSTFRRDDWLSRDDEAAPLRKDEQEPDLPWSQPPGHAGSRPSWTDYGVRPSDPRCVIGDPPLAGSVVKDPAANQLEQRCRRAGQVAKAES